MVDAPSRWITDDESVMSVPGEADWTVTVVRVNDPDVAWNKGTLMAEVELSVKTIELTERDFAEDVKRAAPVRDSTAFVVSVEVSPLMLNSFVFPSNFVSSSSAQWLPERSEKRLIVL